MKRFLMLFTLVMLSLTMLGCSDQTSSAPSDNQAHASNWMKTHPASALSVPNFANCTPCHADNLQGSGKAVSCYSCHAYNTGTDFVIHPTTWVDPYKDHRGYAATNGTTTCAQCHGSDLHGSVAAPSCFSASFDGLRCHPDGPGSAPHPLDGSYLNPANHGPDAKADLTVCQGCHSDNPAGGAGSNPRFNVGIEIAGGTGCEGCHDTYYAHSTNWAGPNNTFHYSAGNTEACKLCHGAALDGVGGVDATGSSPGLSCLSCHAEITSFTLDCTACHNYPPVAGDIIDSSVFPPTTQLVDHNNLVSLGTVADIPSHNQCTTCHGVKDASGVLQANVNYLLFNYTTNTLGDHWNGKIEMNGPSASDPAGGTTAVGAGYNSTTFSCDNAGCHIPFALSDSALPVGFADFGAGANHIVGQDWLLPSGHVAAANSPSPDCFNCHVQTGTSPVAGAPACQDCHINGNPLAVANCASCHTAPPSFASTATVDRPDREGKHAKHIDLTTDTTNCIACHTGGGTGSLTHYDRTGDNITPNYPADVVFMGTSYNSQGSTATYNTGNMSCANVICHGGVTTPNWYTGAIDVYSGNIADCQKCHASSNEYNAYASGQHNRHISNGFATCVSCHDTAVLQNGVAGDSHFSGLKTQGFELDPQLTINANVNYNGTSCNPACHGSENWR